MNLFFCSDLAELPVCPISLLFVLLSLSSCPPGPRYVDCHKPSGRGMFSFDVSASLDVSLQFVGKSAIFHARGPEHVSKTKRRVMDSWPNLWVYVIILTIRKENSSYETKPQNQNHLQQVDIVTLHKHAVTGKDTRQFGECRHNHKHYVFYDILLGSNFCVYLCLSGAVISNLGSCACVCAPVSWCSLGETCPTTLFCVPEMTLQVWCMLRKPISSLVRAR